MNKFESNFFNKYVPEWQSIRWINHIHFVEIFLKLFLWISLWALLPSFIYYYTPIAKEIIPFLFFEAWLLLIYIKVIYDIFDWYNDVWIITDYWVIALEWALLKTSTISVDFWKIEWLEVEQSWMSDKLLKKWDLIIHKFWSDSITLKNAINPYAWVDLIEITTEEAANRKTVEDNKFDLIMDALWWVVENYLWKKDNISEKEEKINRVISKIEKNEWTIDLR